MTLIFTGWRAFYAFRDYAVDQVYLRRMGASAKAEFLRGIDAPKSGRVYRKSGGRTHRASAPGEYPARDSGRHRATVDYKVSGSEVAVGSGMFYARFLRNGTSKMARRLMSDSALNRAIERDEVGVGRFARFRHA
jgi:hypothetical protein